jgi:hypothetical protein
MLVEECLAVSAESKSFDARAEFSVTTKGVLVKIVRWRQSMSVIGPRSELLSYRISRLMKPWRLLV